MRNPEPADSPRHDGPLAYELDTAENVFDIAKVLRATLAEREHVKIPQVATGVVFAILRTAIKRFGTIAQVCATGDAESADILTRSLFEGCLATRFVLHKPQHPRYWSSDVPKPPRPPKALPKIPGDYAQDQFRAREFRALMYHHTYQILAPKPFRNAAKIRGLKRLAGKRRLALADSTVAEAETTLGSDWVQVIKKSSSYSGLSVLQLAERCQLREAHAIFYGPQSQKSHFSTGFSGLTCEEPNTVGTSWLSDEAESANVLAVATQFLLVLLHDVDQTFGLGFAAQITALLQAVGKNAKRRASDCGA